MNFVEGTRLALQEQVYIIYDSKSIPSDQKYDLFTSLLEINFITQCTSQLPPDTNMLSEDIELSFYLKMIKEQDQLVVGIRSHEQGYGKEESITSTTSITTSSIRPDYSANPEYPVASAGGFTRHGNAYHQPFQEIRYSHLGGNIVSEAAKLHFKRRCAQPFEKESFIVYLEKNTINAVVIQRAKLALMQMGLENQNKILKTESKLISIS